MKYKRLCAVESGMLWIMMEFLDDKQELCTTYVHKSVRLDVSIGKQCGLVLCRKGLLRLGMQKSLGLDIYTTDESPF